LFDPADWAWVAGRAHRLLGNRGGCPTTRAQSAGSNNPVEPQKERFSECTLVSISSSPRLCFDEFLEELCAATTSLMIAEIAASLLVIAVVDFA